MKKIYMVSLMFGLFAITSCSKTNNAIKGGGSWNVNSTNNTISSVSIFNTQSVDATASDGTTLRVMFYTAAPGTNGSGSGTYSVVNYWGPYPTANQVGFWSYNSSGFQYGSSGGGTVTVSVTNGIVTIAGSGIPMAVNSGGSAGNSVGNLTFSEYY